MNKVILMILLVLVSYAANAKDDNYKYCSIAGYFTGVEDHFYASIASRKMWELYFNDSICSALYRDGLNIGKSVKKNNSAKEGSEVDIFSQAAEFKAKIERFILKGAGY